MQSVSDGGNQFGSFSILESLLLQLRGEIGPLDVFGNDVAGTVLSAADIMHRNYAGMIEIGDGASFGQICLGVFGPGKPLSPRNLDGDWPVQLVVMGQVNPTKSAFTQDFLDTVATNLFRLIGWGSNWTRRPFIGRRRIHFWKIVRGVH